MPDNIPYKIEVPSVSELTQKIKNLLESNFTDILVEGELSNVKQSRSGHLYFTVKDNDAQLPCVMWRSMAQRLGTKIVDGQQVVLGGSIQVYPPHGRYQLIVNLVEQAGIGKLQQAFEALKKKLKEEGLFEQVHKKSLPSFPNKIGVITSTTGAAFHDIRSTLERRWPVANVLLYHASVQGVNAAPELVKALKHFSSREDIDLLIIGRGGGSLEDLWPFNEESVARAVFNCPIPVISAVGHEVDFSISDFVADARAATPTQAAILATPDINEIKFMIEDLGNTLNRNVRDKIERYQEKVRRLGDSHALLVVANRIDSEKKRVANFQERMQLYAEKTITGYKERFKELEGRMEYRREKILAQKKEHLTGLIHRLEKRDPNAPLEKGFTRIWQNKKWIRKPAAFKKDEAFEIEWKDRKINLES